MPVIPVTQKAVAGRSQVPDQSQQLSKTLLGEGGCRIHHNKILDFMNIHNTINAIHNTAI